MSFVLNLRTFFFVLLSFLFFLPNYSFANEIQFVEVELSKTKKKTVVETIGCDGAVPLKVGKGGSVKTFDEELSSLRSKKRRGRAVGKGRAFFAKIALRGTVVFSVS